jgi:hypothetical protein
MDPRLTSPDEFWAVPWRKRFAAHGYADFETLWKLELPPLDVANETRGGISTVALLVLTTADFGDCRLVVKRQRNHQSRTWRHPLRGVPTLQKEFQNIRCFNHYGLATVEPVYFARWRDDEGIRAILITEYLEGYQSFDTCLEAWTKSSDPLVGSREVVLRTAAALIARMHLLGFQHNCLYPKHLFVNSRSPRPDVRLIDLEKAGRRVFARRRMTRDLGAFFRRSDFWTPAVQERFMVYYHGASDLTPEVSRSLLRIQQAMLAKTKQGTQMEWDR